MFRIAERIHIRREIAVALVLAAAVSACVVLLPTPGGDAAAHLYRTSLVRHGILVWDNLWFAGDYPLLSYSLLYYLPAALVGNVLLGVVSVVASAGLFASILARRWGPDARWPSRSFAVLVTGQLFTAAYPFDAGLAALLLAIWALQRSRRVTASVAAVLTVGFSPLAFFFLVLAALAFFLHERRLDRGTVGFGALLGVLTTGQLGLALLGGAARLVYPFGLWRFLAGSAIAVAGLALARRHRSSGPLPMLFGVWTAATAVLFLVPTAIGHNVLRASVFLFPLILLAVTLRGFRPRATVFGVLAAALGAVTIPYLSMIDARAADPLASPAAWRGALAFLHRHEGADFRVEVVPTSNHWEAYYVAGAGFALARGWYRQLDLADNAPLYARTLSPRSYRAWLRQEGVRYVLLPRGALEAIDAAREARLLRSGRSGLTRVWSDADGTIFELPHATPLLTGPGAARVTAMTSRVVAGRVDRPGRYLLRVHYTSSWSTRPRTLCVRKVPGSDMTELDVSRAGTFTLTAAEQPTAFLESLLDTTRRC